ncbi:MAG: VanZ family protein [Lachnospiraceae bacterium]|nr:VanZ family protein [Lachnospiraceae bacterium]
MKKKGIGTGWIWLLFLVYLGFLLYFLFLSEHFGRTERVEGFQYNLQPFQEIGRYFRHRNALPQLFLINIVGNIGAFLPFGLLLPSLLPKRMRRLLVVFCLTYLFSLSVECVQMLTHVGIFDLDDIILNTLGGVLGYLCYIVLRKAGLFSGG